MESAGAIRAGSTPVSYTNIIAFACRSDLLERLLILRTHEFTKGKAESVIGQCKLCLKQKQLLESHLMPRALYAPGKKGIQYATRSQSGQNPEHIKAHLLCFDCEQRFDHLGESEVLRWLAPKARKTFPLHDRLRVALPCGEIQGLSIFNGVDVGLDMNKFAYFTLSVAWRRSIHEWMNFDGTPLPQWGLGTFGEQMRSFLVGETGFPPDTAIMVIVCSDEYTRQFWTAPSTDVVYHCLGFEFIARGVYFRGLMGHNLHPGFHNVSCASPYGRILHGHCRSMTEEKLQLLAFPN